MARPIRVDRKKLKAAAVASPRYQKYQDDIAEDIIEESKDVFKARQRDDNEDRTSENTPPKYLESFEIQEDDEGVKVVNTDRYAVHTEFGAHAGGTTPVLNYRPMSTALEIVANREGAT